MPKPKEPSTTKDKTKFASKHEQGKKLAKFKKDNNLPDMKEIQKNLSMGLAEQVERRLKYFAEYNALQEQVLQLVHGAGWDVANIVNSIVDLQGKLFELEAKLEGEGINPLESDEYMRARKMLTDQIQYIHKHKLDVAEFRHKVQKKKEDLDDDSIFTVEDT